MRVLPVGAIPTELWDNKLLRLPKSSIACYVNELSARNLFEDAKKGTEKKAIHGGCGQAETLEHFTYRFSVSAGRVAFTTISPDTALTPISDALLTTFSEGRVTLLDIPCGHGSSGVTLLTTLATLRANKKLPLEPLTVTVVGGDCSPTALQIYDSLLTYLRPILAKHGVEINWQTKIWDATRSDSTAKLVDDWFAFSSGAGEYVVCISNFSGALTDAGLFEAVKPSLEQILGRLHDKKSTLLWVEPTSPSLKAKFFPKIVNFFKQRIGWFASATKKNDFQSANYKMEDPLTSNTFDSGVEVHRFVRN